MLVVAGALALTGLALALGEVAWGFATVSGIGQGGGAALRRRGRPGASSGPSATGRTG